METLDQGPEREVLSQEARWAGERQNPPPQPPTSLKPQPADTAARSSLGTPWGFHLG